VFRRYHIGPVWRADRPQKGRFREFYQCDIDVVGGASPAYEVEIITATERVLKELNLGKYRFRLSDKRLLPLLLKGFGAAEDRIGSLAILLDKLDKVPMSEIRSEILQVLPAGSHAVKNLFAFIEEAGGVRTSKAGESARVALFEEFWGKIGDMKIRAQIDEILKTLNDIMDSVCTVNKTSSIGFDPILVRGMDYYTGPIYE